MNFNLYSNECKLIWVSSNIKVATRTYYLLISIEIKTKFSTKHIFKHKHILSIGL
jgi:hypothetical protein